MLEEKRGICSWCGVKINNTNSRIDHERNVCKKCEENRGWLLNSIRFSDKASKYIIKTEEREKPLRESRELEAKVKEEQEKEVDLFLKKEVITAIPNDQEARMMRLEKMLNKLTSALGV